MDLERFIHLYEIKSRAILEQSENQEIMEVNNLGFIAVLMFLTIPTAFLLIPYVKTASASSGSN
uniref:Photosystem II reaction center protein M n=13 Tax=Pinaceae TaxID=3318 RepID=A0A410SNC9_PINPU|nr:PSII M protein [Pinus pumila]QAT97691.1 PSII M protein [Pinus pumila]